MFCKRNYILGLIVAFLFGFAAGISIGFYLTGDIIMTVLIACMMGAAAALAYFTYLIVKNSF